MAGNIGRETTITVGAAAIAGVRTKGVTCNAEPVDITDDDSAGWQELLADPARQSVEVSVAGVIKGDVMREAFFTRVALEAVVITYGAGGTLQGDFFVSSYTEGNEYEDASTFEATLTSGGAITYTAPI